MRIMNMWQSVAIGVFVVLVNFLFAIRVGLAYAPYDWVQYFGSYGSGPYGSNGPYVIGGPYGSGGPYTVAGVPVYIIDPNPLPVEGGPTVIGVITDVVKVNIPKPSPPPCLYVEINPFDPPHERTYATRNAVLRWRTNYDLKPDEVFDVLLWPEGSEAQTSIGTTRDKIFPLDMVRWPYSGTLGRFFWTIRIKGPQDYVSCPIQPMSFVLTGLPEGRPSEPEPNAPPPAPPPIRNCPPNADTC